MDRKGTTKSQGRKHSQDKFYTKPEIAKQCIDFIDDIKDYDVIIEPAAGNGSFSQQIEGCLAFDINPESSEIIKQDWFEYKQERDVKKILVIGNPPFGVSNTLALKFINHAADFADTIAFILPISFKKYSVQDKIDKNLHKTKEMVLPKNSFILGDVEYDVPCIFQIWEWKKEERDKRTRKTSSEFFDFVKKEDNPDCRIQRVGGNAGKASIDLDKSSESNYFIRIKNDMSVQEFVDYTNTLVFPGRDYGVGPRTLSKDELITVFEENYPS